ncbi:MAG: NAD(+)--dinitrogen-reductase ADP-D-ribosyltransferase, partial [Rhodocyclaceae bacterium]|nr:NAD(+)--dinitrogen-reductase ADP-D-ribosyltransferase [Rhodocyclaceae bacterium]
MPSLPRDARLPINRCNLPAVILGGLTYQHHPAPLALDGVAELHKDLFRRLDTCLAAGRRAEIFQDYVTVRFCLEQPEEAGFTGGGKGRAKANYP